MLITVSVPCLKFKLLCSDICCTGIWDRVKKHFGVWDFLDHTGVRCWLQGLAHFWFTFTPEASAQTQDDVLRPLYLGSPGLCVSLQPIEAVQVQLTSSATSCEWQTVWKRPLMPGSHLWVHPLWDLEPTSPCSLLAWVGSLSSGNCAFLATLFPVEQGTLRDSFLVVLWEFRTCFGLQFWRQHD